LFIVIFMKMKEELIKKLVQIQLQWKFLHWQTFGDANIKLMEKYMTASEI